MSTPCRITLDDGVLGNRSTLAPVSHVGLISTAVTICELIEAGDSRFRAWS